LPNDEEPHNLEALMEGLVSEDVCKKRGYFCLPISDRAPKQSEWKDEERPEVKLSFDKTENMIWKIAKSEILTIRENVKKSLNCGGSRPSIKDIESLFFGPASKLSSIFQAQLEIDPKTFMKFMSTLHLAKELTIPILHDGRIITED
jgi:hypothetical protein